MSAPSPKHAKSSSAEYAQELEYKFTCPITSQIFHEPVLLSDGNFYEKQAISKWFRFSDKSPSTNLQIRCFHLVEVTIFNNELKKYKESHPNADVYEPEFDFKELMHYEKYDEIISSGKKNFDINYKLGENQIKSHIKKYINNVEFVKYLIENNINISYENQTTKMQLFGCIFLYSASPAIICNAIHHYYHHNKEIFNTPINNVINTKPNHIICERYNFQTVIIILTAYFNSGILLTDRDYYGFTSLDYICKKCNNLDELKKIIDLYISNGYGTQLIRINRKKESPLYYILQKKNPRMTKYIIEVCDKNDINLDTICNLDSNMKPIHCICATTTTCPEIIRMMIDIYVKKGYDLNSKTSSGKSPLHILCKYNSVQETIKYVIDIYIQKNLDIDIGDNSHMRPIDYIFNNNFFTIEIIKYIYQIYIEQDIDLMNIDLGITTFNLLFCIVKRSMYIDIEMYKHLLKVYLLSDGGSYEEMIDDDDVYLLHYIFQHAPLEIIKITIDFYYENDIKLDLYTTYYLECSKDFLRQNENITDEMLDYYEEKNDEQKKILAKKEYLKYFPEATE